MLRKFLNVLLVTLIVASICFPLGNAHSCKAEANINGNLRVVTLGYTGAWKAYDVDVVTGAKTTVPSFTDFTAFDGYHNGSTGDALFSTMAYTGDNKLRVVTLGGGNIWKAYDVDVVTGAKTTVPSFIDFTAFEGNHNGSTGDALFSTMSQLNNNPQIILASPSANQSFSEVSGYSQITVSGTVTDADDDNCTVIATLDGVTKTQVVNNCAGGKPYSITFDVATDSLPEGTPTISVTADDGK